MKCDFARQNSKEFDDLIDDYLSGRLPQKEAEAFELHYLYCDDCFRALQIRKQMRAVIKEKGETLFAKFIQEEAEQESKNRSRRLPGTLRNIGHGKNFLMYIGGMAAAFLILVLYLAIDWRNPPLPETFSETPYLEERIETQNYKRSGNGFQLVAPGNGANFSPKTPILFRWENPGSEPLKLKILNNKGDKLFSFAVDDHQFLLREALPSGLYYWKVESDDEFRIGKFFVR